MRLKDPELLAFFRATIRCEWCGVPLCHPAHPHHIISRGAGGPDIPENLIALGGPWDCNCHGEHHAGHRPIRCDLWALVAHREGKSQAEVRSIVNIERRAGRAPQRTSERTGEAVAPDQPHIVCAALPPSVPRGRSCLDLDEAGWHEL